MAEWEYALALDDDGKWKEAEKWFEDWFPFPQEEHIADLRARMGVGNG